MKRTQLARCVCIFGRMSLCLALMLGVCFISPGKAYGADLVTYVKGDLYEYGGGCTQYMYIDGQPAYCANPGVRSPEEGVFEKLDLNAASGRTDEVAAVLWFGYGSPGFDASLWPNTWYDGGGMNADHYAALTHILCSEVFWSNGPNALHGCNQEFSDWVFREVFGYDQNGTVVNESASGRRIAERVSEVPWNFHPIMINNGVETQVVVSFRYNPDEPRPEQPAISTTASDAADGDKYIQAGSRVSLVDTVEYSRLSAGESYQLSGELMLKSGDPVVGKNGVPVTASKSFTAKNESGSVSLTFTFDARDVEGKDVVVFESLTQGDIEVASHRDLRDKGQTVRIVGFGTTAQDGSDKDKYVSGESATVIDRVSFKGLTAGQNYRIVGTLIDTVTGKKIACEGSDGKKQIEVAFSPEKANGSQDVTFSFDAEKAKGHRLVVFEKLYMGDVLIASHEDQEDLGQSVYSVALETVLTDSADGDHVVQGDRASLVDTVQYWGLVAGETYTMRGTLVTKPEGLPLMDAAGSPVAAAVDFVAESSEGEVRVAFEFDTALFDENTELVAFEVCENKDGGVVVTHEDLNSESQTVVVTFPEKELPPDSVMPKTADSLAGAALLVAAIASGAAIALVILRKKGENR